MHNIVISYGEFTLSACCAVYSAVKSETLSQLVIGIEFGTYAIAVFQLMYNMINKCLNVAAENGLTSIAFPTVGCGRMGYRPEDVASCFSRAMQRCKTPISVIIRWSLQQIV